MSTRAFQIYALAVLLAGLALEAGLILSRTGGQMIYTLDDPYIHLALAEEILRGQYGINPGEVASPSSSMLYPLLLAPLLALGLGTLAPLLLAVTGQGIATWLLAGAFAPRLRHLVLALLAGPLMVQAVNGFALPLTGMEHPLHIALSVAALIGLSRAAGGEMPRWLLPVLICLPAIRFEGYALSLLVTLALWWLGERRAAMMALFGVVALTALYATAMVSLGLPLLPSSVLVKSTVSAAAIDADGQGAVGALIASVQAAVRTLPGALMTLVMLGLALMALIRRDRATGVIVLTALLAVVAHLMVGRFGWFGRYEVYAVALTLAAVFLTLRSSAALPLLLCAAFGWGYLPTLIRTPAAALAIHQQQHQMHRFATEYFPHPVAVHDLGWVAYDNDIPVLDLWGLGSEEARRLTAEEGRTIATVRVLTEGRADYAMLYDTIFAGAIPPDWCRVAVLTTSRVIFDSDSVSLWLIDRSREAEMRAALDAFAPTLPAGATLRQHDCP